MKNTLISIIVISVIAIVSFNHLKENRIQRDYNKSVARNTVDEFYRFGCESVDGTKDYAKIEILIYENGRTSLRDKGFFGVGDWGSHYKVISHDKEWIVVRNSAYDQTLYLNKHREADRGDSTHHLTCRPIKNS